MKKKVKTIVILGGTSAVAMAYARAQAKSGHVFCLVGRKKTKLTANQTDLLSRGASTVHIYVANMGKAGRVKNHWTNIEALCPNIDQVLLAYSVLGEQADTQIDLRNLQTNLETNFVSAALWAELSYAYFLQQGHGQFTLIGSVAGDRGRQSNYHYGATKGGLEVFLSGMAHRAARTREAKINVLLVKPGFIDTPMTDHLDKGGPLWVTPEKIATIIMNAERRSKTKVYAPWFWCYILMVIRYLPKFIFHKSSL